MISFTYILVLNMKSPNTNYAFENWSSWVHRESRYPEKPIAKVNGSCNQFDRSSLPQPRLRLCPHSSSPPPQSVSTHHAR